MTDPRIANLERRIRFHFSPIVAVGIMIAIAFEASDMLAMKVWRGVFWCGLFELGVVWNIIARQRLQRQLRWIINGQCAKCGYDLRETPVTCPECGAAAKH